MKCENNLGQFVQSRIRNSKRLYADVKALVIDFIIHLGQGSHRIEKYLNLEGFLEKSY